MACGSYLHIAREGCDADSVFVFSIQVELLQNIVHELLGQVKLVLLNFTRGVQEEHKIHRTRTVCERDQP